MIILIRNFFGVNIDKKLNNNVVKFIDIELKFLDNFMDN